MGTIAELLDQLDDADPTMVSAHVAALRAHPDLGDVGGVEAGRAAQALLTHGGMRDVQAAADLAKRAHDGGVPGAGRVLATCIDRFTFLGTRTQRFGTLTMEHQGDLLLAPTWTARCDDEVRASVGMPPLAALRAEVDEANRVRARERAAAGGLPNGMMFARVWRDPTEEQLRARWAEVGEPVWADGDELTFVCDKPLAGALVGPIFELPMWPVGGLLVLTVRVHRLDEVVLTYAWWPLSAEGTPAFSRRPDPDGRFRGANARPPAPTNDEIVGTLTEVAVESKNLGEPRKVTVYRPPGHTVGREAAGRVCHRRAVLRPLCPPARRCHRGGHGAPLRRGGIPRRAEPDRRVLPRLRAEPFDRHQRFFVDELSALGGRDAGRVRRTGRAGRVRLLRRRRAPPAVGLAHHPRSAT